MGGRHNEDAPKTKPSPAKLHGEGVGTPLGDVRRQEHPELTGREVASLRVRVQRHSLQQCRHEGGVLAECARQAGVRVLSQCKAQKEQLNRCLAQWQTVEEFLRMKEKYLRDRKAFQRGEGAQNYWRAYRQFAASKGQWQVPVQQGDSGTSQDSTKQ